MDGRKVQGGEGGEIGKQGLRMEVVSRMEREGEDIERG